MVLAERSERRSQAADDVWLAIRAANPSIGQGGVRPAVDGAAVLLAIGGGVLVSHHIGGMLHTFGCLVTAALVVTLVGVGVKAVRRWQHTRTTRRAFAALPPARKETAAAEYNELQKMSPELFPHRLP